MVVSLLACSKYRLITIPDQLYAKSNLETPVAYAQPTTRTSPLVLVVESEAMSFIDQIIASFIAREKELRAEESKANRSAGMLVAKNPIVGGWLAGG